MRHLVVGDIHGSHIGLQQCLKKSKFNPEKDTLIGIGDYTDGNPHSAEVVEYLRKLPNFIGILGNHDVWTKDFLEFGKRQPIWVEQGGKTTIESYLNKSEFLLTSSGHLDFFKKLHHYYILKLNGLIYAFVHGGWLSREGLGYEEFPTDYYWDRKLWDNSRNQSTSDYSKIRTKMYDKVFLGHTATEFDYPDCKPVKTIDKIWNVDTGAGWSGRLTIMDIETEEYWQSDKTQKIYPKGGRIFDPDFKKKMKKRFG